MTIPLIRPILHPERIESPDISLFYNLVNPTTSLLQPHCNFIPRLFCYSPRLSKGSGTERTVAKREYVKETAKYCASQSRSVVLEEVMQSFAAVVVVVVVVVVVALFVLLR